MHQPVLLKEVLEYLNPQSGENFIDCTLGLAGHALALLERNKPGGKVLGIERDRKVLEILREKISDKRLILAQGNFADLKKIVKENNFYSAKGILFDLGISSWQLEKSGRGFSFQRNEPLLMSCQSEIKSQELTAEEIVNNWPEEELVRIFQEYGEERYAKRIAQSICQNRRIELIKTTGQLVEAIKQAVPKKYKYGRIHFATRVFQALRIAVNDELNNLKKALPQALEILEKNGRLVVISFHSLEDRIVKNFFRESAQKEDLEILTKKPMRSSQEEIELNPRSRSAKLRVAMKI
jgi:16S rRNA (cytosine1402-N4)-methyltransferase